MLLFGHCFTRKPGRDLNKRQHVFKKRMSGGLMSCVRENSPPLDMDINVSGPLSLPEPSINNSDLMGSLHSSSHHNIMSSTPLAAQSSSHIDGVGGGGTPNATPPNTEQTKRRRFHPLRNLRRIFRRRTITSATTAAGETPTSTLTGTTASSNSEKNLRSATLSSIQSVVSASSPSSPLTHQQLQDAYLTQSLPKSKSSYSSLLGGGRKPHSSSSSQSHDYNLNGETKSAKSKHKHKNQKHQQQSKELELQQQQSEDMFGTTTQTSASYHHVQQHHSSSSSTTTTSGSMATTKSSLLSQRQSMGVAVFPAATNRSFFTERQKLRSVGDSSQDLDSGSGNDSGTGGGHNISPADRAKSGGSASGGEMSDSQRSLSEGRLVDSDYSRDGLSQSHDSVFSESATASSLSIVLKAELADVLRKRRNRPDASDEDLGLPRSPASPQRRTTTSNATGMAATSSNIKSNVAAEKHSEVSSLSLLSMNSTDGEDAIVTSTANNSTTEIVQERSTSASRYSRSSTMSSISMSNDILRHRDSSFNEAKDEVDLFSSDWQRLSHAAAKHKMAIRPTKKKGGPSRQHRRTLETSIPEANEDLNKFVNKQMLEVKDLDIKTKTRSLPPSVNAAKLMDEQLAINVKNTATTTTSTKESITKTTKIINTTTTSSTTSSSSTTNNIFGLRNLTAKASAMFESKDSNALQAEDIAKKPDLSKKSDISDKQTTTIQPMETNETGFLRRLMHRNSKRTIAKANAGEEQDQDELDKKQNEPKKLQMTINAPTTSLANIEKIKSDYSGMRDESCLEEKRKEIKREIYNEGKTVSVTVSGYAEDKSPSKPKSGPAARQRYLPQNISNEDLMKLNEEKPIPKETLFSKSSTNECFQSTSIIREITKQQSGISSSSHSPSKPEHHFEKKPKIVGLSAFQQKISKSNESFARANTSANTSLASLDRSEEELTSPVRLQIYEQHQQKQRKSVEKSRSFRAYGEQKESPTTVVHNNMPSLPDLSVNLRIPYCRDFIVNEKEYSSPSPPEPLDEKHASLGFEINDNKLVKPERESRKSFGNYDKNIIMTTSTGGSMANKAATTPTKLLTPANVTTFSTMSNSTSLSTASCNKNISEIENNIDLIVKSPFVSVIRKSINLTDAQADEVVKINNIPTTGSTTAINTAAEKVRPTVLALKKEKSLSEENILNTPSTASVTLREKATVKTNTLFLSNLENAKEMERKSAPVVNNSSNSNANKSNGFRCNSTRRSSSVVESTNEQNPNSKVPEFMKIQLNRVDATRTSKSHVVLAKNVKELPILDTRESTPEKISSMDDLSFRRLSSESVDINERETPESDKRFSGIYHEAINKSSKLCSGLPPKSPVKKTPTTPTTPPTPTINEREQTQFKIPETFESSTNSSTSVSLSNSNSLSLQERRRLFMAEEKSKLEKKVEEIKYERKKSICEDMLRKSSLKSETDQKEAHSPTNENNGVILRKKSFASSVHSLNGNSINGVSTTGGNNKDDPTPELMKVFARRSLKIKDEDLDKMLSPNGNTTINNNNNNNISASQSLKKFASSSSSSSSTTTNVDSDKENQSASDEKLDKLPKLEMQQSITITKINTTHIPNNHSTLNGSSCNNNNNTNRNSLADFRLGGNKSSHSGLSLNNSSNNNNNNNNNNNSSSNGDSSPLNNTKSFLPPIKVSSGFRAISIERNNNNNNSTHLISPSKTSSSTLERSTTVKLGDLTSSSSTDVPMGLSKTIERSATVGEFKGIHQRRAEWEQRAKEALK